MRKYPEIIDLHMHTTVSDGTDTPKELVKRVRKEGIELFSCTDHDAIKGCKAILRYLTAEDPKFVTGVEFSCKDDLGKYHILGYGYDPAAKPIRDVVGTGHRYRMTKVKRRLQLLKEQYGVEFPPEEVKKLLAMDNPGKPHIGNLMAKYGFAPSKDIAIKDYLNKIVLGSEYVKPEEAIQGIIGSGGIPVLAHPSYGSGDQIIVGSEMDERLRRLMGFGLEGVEAFYSGFTSKLTNEMLAFAKKYNLYVTAGSDYHGTNKLIEPGDTGLDRTSDGPEGLFRFLDRLLS